jgi:hypothetical protein
MMINNFGKAILFLVSLNAFSFLPVSAQKVVTGTSKTKPPVLFMRVLETRLAEFDSTIENFCPQNNIFTRRILREYGAAFVGEGRLPRACFLKDENSVRQTQNQLGFSTETVGGVRIELQKEAMKALLKAVAEAKKQGSSITPKGGAPAARRSFADSLGYWDKRVRNGLNHWVGQKKVSAKRANEIRAMKIFEQVAAILELEEKGIYFSTQFDKSILQSVAAPGASQHNLMLALDVAEYPELKVRRILAKHGWFQTVASDKPHFTYLGVEEDELPALGLHSIIIEGQLFWIPQM